MSTEMTLRVNSESLSETERIAAAIGQSLQGGETIALQSDLGGGKTAFVRGLALGMGSEETVASPTFTLSREYGTPSGLRLYHFDFYRLSEPGIMASELREILADPRAVVAVEWSDIVAEVLPAEHMTISLTRTGEDSRAISITYPTSWNYVVQGL